MDASRPDLDVGLTAKKTRNTLPGKIRVARAKFRELHELAGWRLTCADPRPSASQLRMRRNERRQ